MIFNIYDTKDPVVFYDSLYSDLKNTTLINLYTFLRLNYFYQTGRVTIVKNAKPTSNLQIGVDYMDPYSIDRSPVTINNQTYNYEADSEPISLPGVFGTVNTDGYHIPIYFFNSTLRDKYRPILVAMNDLYHVKSFVIQIAILNPSMSKLGCVYKAIHVYNADTVKYSFILIRRSM